jgi:hypothetical protein
MDSLIQGENPLNLKNLYKDPYNSNDLDGGAKKKAATKNRKGIQYVIEKIDGMPTHDLVIKYKNGKKVGQKVVAVDTLKAASANSLEKSKHEKGKKTKIVYVNVENPKQAQQPVIVQNQAGFGEYVKAGFGLGVGEIAAEAMFDGIADLF